MSKRRALLLCLAVYLAAALAAILAVLPLAGGHPVLIAFVADLAATAAVFAFSAAFNNSSLYDPYWSVAPPLIALYWLWISGYERAPGLRSLIALILILVWSVRLTLNWARQWRGIEHEDWRYVDLRRRCRSWYWPVSFLGIHLFPTLAVFLGCLPLYAVMRSGTAAGRNLNPLDAAAFLVTLGAIVLEAASDRQLHRFIQSGGHGERILASGLWGLCRHPNYLGEISFWWGLYLFALAAAPGYWWTAVGALVVTGLFLGISIPMMDRHLLKRRPEYSRYMQEVPALFPPARFKLGRQQDSHS